MNVGDIGLDVLTSCGEVVGREFLLVDRLLEVLAKTLLDLVGKKFDQSFVRSGFDGLVGSRNGRAEIAPGWLGGIFAGPMDAHQRFKEVLVCERLRLRA